MGRSLELLRGTRNLASLAERDATNHMICKSSKGRMKKRLVLKYVKFWRMKVVACTESK